MRSSILFGLSAIVCLAASLCGCSQTLIATPYVMYGEAGRAYYDRVPETLRSAEAPIIYVTDRAVDRTTPSGPHYGFKRNPRFVYGLATATLGTNATWDQIVADSTSPDHRQNYRPGVTKVEELGSFTPIAALMEPKDGWIRPKPDALETLFADTETFHALIARQAEQAGAKDVVLFVHGFNNTFDDAVIRMAMAWHMGGRVGLPMVYTWPAGSGGLLGYFFDRESGEFTIVHLKRLIVALATCPGIERIHIIAHSRGTDVATTALRELNSEIRGASGAGYVSKVLGLTERAGADAYGERPPYKLLKLATLVLAAPDLDMEVFQQRFFGENLLNIAERTVIYISPADQAIAIANWLFGSKNRIGTLKAKDMTPEQQDRLSKVTRLELINCDVKGGSSHAYAAQHPSALSDLILLLRDRVTPGPGTSRPLTQPIPGVWEMSNTYLKPGSK
ncbi:MAG: alpha/beta hydrolase [Phycisphaerae bacterium]|nr:alpha/beta hydrolase [Phycisphaerae bacterium]